jgi:hypothetical protein
MTKLTINGVSTTNGRGQEQYEFFNQKIGQRTKVFCAYDYRHTDGELFSCVKPTLDACKVAKNA